MTPWAQSRATINDDRKDIDNLEQPAKEEQGRWVAKRRAGKAADVGRLSQFKQGAKLYTQKGIWSADMGWSDIDNQLMWDCPTLTSSHQLMELELWAELDYVTCLN